MFPVFRPQPPVHRLQSVQRLVLARGPQQPVAVRLGLHQRGAVDQGLGRVPDDVTHGLLRVDPQQVLEDGEEGDLLGRVLHTVVHGVEHVQVGGEIHIVRRALASLVTLLLLLEHVELNLEVRVLGLGLDVPEDLQQFQS